MKIFILILLAAFSIGCKGAEQKKSAPQAIEAEKIAPIPETQATTAKVIPSLWKPMGIPSLKGAVKALIQFQEGLMAGVEKQGVSLFNSETRTWEAVPGLENKSVLTFKVCGSELFAGTEAFGVYQYLRDKKQWVPMSRGLFQARKGPSPKGDVTGESPPNCDIDECRYNRDVYGLACDATHLYAATDRAVYVTSLKDPSWKELWGPLSGIHAITLVGDELYIGRDGGADVCGVYKIKSGDAVIKEATQQLSCRSIISLFSFQNNLLASVFNEVLLKKKGAPDWDITGKNMDYIRFNLCQEQVYGTTSYEGDHPVGRTYRFRSEKKDWELISEGIQGEELSSFTSANSQIYGGTQSGKLFSLDCR